MLTGYNTINYHMHKLKRNTELYEIPEEKQDKSILDNFRRKRNKSVKTDTECQ